MKRNHWKMLTGWSTLVLPILGLASVQTVSPGPTVPDFSFPESSGATSIFMITPRMDGVIGKFEWSQFYGQPIAGGPEFAGTPLLPVANTIVPANISTDMQKPVPSIITISPQNPVGNGMAPITTLTNTGMPPVLTGKLPPPDPKLQEQINAAKTLVNSSTQPGGVVVTTPKIPISGKIGSSKQISVKGTKPKSAGSNGTQIIKVSDADSDGQNVIQKQIAPTKIDSRLLPNGKFTDATDNNKSKTNTVAPLEVTIGKETASGVATVPMKVDGKATPDQAAAPITTLQTIPVVQTPTPIVAPNISAGFASWAPNALEVAAVVAQGRDLVVSLDTNGDSRPFGKSDGDYEVRISPSTQKITVQKDVNGVFQSVPEWADAVKFTVSPSPSTPGSQVIEVMIKDPTESILPSSAGKFVGLRLDGILPTDVTTATQTRALSLLKLEPTLGPNGSANAEIGDSPLVSLKGKNSSVPGESNRLTFEIQRVPDSFAGGTFMIEGVGISGSEVKGGGLAQLSGSIPAFGSNHEVRINYNSYLSSDAVLGTGGVHLHLSALNGTGYDYVFPYQVQEWLTIDSVPKKIYSLSKAQQIDLQARITSNIHQRMQGSFEVSLPDGWKMVKGNQKEFVIYSQGGVSKRAFSILVPPNVKGDFVIALKCVLPTKTITKLIHINVL